MVFNLCKKSFNDHDLAEETTQDIFVKVHQKLHTFSNKSSIKTWIYTIALNTIRDTYKSKSFKNLQNTSCCDQYYEKIQEMNNELELKDFEEIHCLYKAIHQLPEIYKMIIILRYIDELSIQEIAQITGDTVKSIDGRLARAKIKLKTLVKNLVID